MKHLFPILVVLAFFGCTHQQKEPEDSGMDLITIAGEIEDGEQVLVTLDRIGALAFEPLDSARCDQKGRFSFSIQGEGMDFYKLKYTENGYVTLIAFPGDQLMISGQADTLYPYHVEGSEYSMQLMRLAERHQRTLAALSEISERSREILHEPDYSTRKLDLNRRYDSITAEFKNHSRNFIYNNSASPALLVALYNVYGSGLPVFDLPEDLDVYRFVDSSLNAQFPQNEAVKSLHTMVVATEAQLRNLKETDPSLKIGMKAPDFVALDASEAPVALKDYRGNPLLLQFWASWSQPSMEQNRYLEMAYDRFSEQGLNILQVSLDSDPDAWRMVADPNHSDWVHLCDFGRWESPIVRLYRLERIPANFLIDENGTIIRKDIFDQALIETLENYLNK